MVEFQVCDGPLKLIDELFDARLQPPWMRMNGPDTHLRHLLVEDGGERLRLVAKGSNVGELEL